MSSTWGKNIKLSIFGESHGPAIGCVIDGIKAGLLIDIEQIKNEMKRRKSISDLMTPRHEQDEFEIISGIKNGYTTGSPLCMIIKNTDYRENDYLVLDQIMRPGHSDYPAHIKHHGFNQKSGGGHFSGRLTAPLVFAGAIAKQLLVIHNIEFGSHLANVGPIQDDRFDLLNPEFADICHKELPVINDELILEIKEYLLEAKERKDSVGASIEATAVNLPIGLGEPFFASVEGNLSGLLFSIPGVKGVEFGLGFEFVSCNGGEVIDSYQYENGDVVLTANNNGGILGGLTTGAPLIVRVAFKPTSSIGQPMQTINVVQQENETLLLEGRHDTCIALRAGVIVEACMALTILDLMGDYDG